MTSTTLFPSEVDTEDSAARTRAADTVCCPECGRPSTVEWRFQLAGTDGPIEHVKIHCDSRHWFLMPAEGLLPYRP